MDRFQPPAPGPATAVRFPPIFRETLSNGLDVQSIRHASVPLVTVVLSIGFGTADDPADQPGLASFTADLLDEGAGSREAIALSDAFAQLGSQLEIEAGADETVLVLSTLSRTFRAALDLVGDVVIRPHLEASGLARVRDLRLGRLRQMSQSAAAMADRAFVGEILPGHPYGHGSLGTTRALTSFAQDDVRMFWSQMAGPRAATLIVAGDLEPNDAIDAARRTFGDWTGGPVRRPPEETAAPAVEPRLLLVDRPGAPQSELRVGHVAPWRRTDRYHAVVTLNALLGGQFTSRINRRLREEKGVTYGARTSFDLRKTAGTFSCETSVHGDATTMAIVDILQEMSGVREDGAVPDAELTRAKASLTRGYVRGFETAGHFSRAAALLVPHGLDIDTFERFVPSIERVTAVDVAQAAREFVRPHEATVVVVGDAAKIGPSLSQVGLEIRAEMVEF